MKRSIDEQLLDWANYESRILLTNDKDFGELVYLQGKNSSGIILMRFVNDASSVKVKYVASLLDQYEDRLTGHFTVIAKIKFVFVTLRIK